MSAPTCRALLVGAAGVGLAGPAHATATITFCAEYQVDYADVDLESPHKPEYEGDYFYSSSNKKARGVTIHVERDDSTVVTKHADWTGTDAGCATFTLDETRSYTVSLITNLEVNGNTLSVRNNDTANNQYIGTARHVASGTKVQGWSPNAGTNTVDITTANTHPAWNIAAAAGWAMTRRHAGLANKTFIFYNDQGTCGGSCEKNGKAYFDTLGTELRVVIVHEMGHMLDFFLGDNLGSLDYNANEVNCITDTGQSHELASKEWHSAGIREGWAHFYAAVAFNDVSEADCGFAYYKEQDYDQINGIDGATSHAISCETGPGNVAPLVDAKDYLGDWCSGTLENRATELDWLRFWWDFMQEESTVSFTDCADILGMAIRGDFITPAAAVWIDDATNSDPAVRRPPYRMRASADELGLLTEWDAQDNDNGVHR